MLCCLFLEHSSGIPEEDYSNSGGAVFELHTQVKLINQVP